MSKVQIEIPDDRWFRGEWAFRPKDRQLCAAIHKYGGNTPWLHPKNDYFLDVSEKWNLDSLGIDEWEPSFLEWWGVDRWKPLGIPTDVEERVLAEIEKWFEEDDE